MKRKNLSKLNKLLIVALVLSVFIGTLAVYVDRETANASIATIENGVDITPTPDPTVTPDDPTKPDPEDYVDPTPNDPTDDLTNWWLYLNSRATVNFNPGDKMTLNYILKNTGDLAVDIRETFIVTSSQPLSATPEFRLFTTYTNDVAGANFGGEVVVNEERIDDTHYKYTVDPYVMNSETETINGAQPASISKPYYLVFDLWSGNEFQADTCTVDYIVEAKQHTDDAADWVIAATGTMSVAGQDLAVVPAAN